MKLPKRSNLKRVFESVEIAQKHKTLRRKIQHLINDGYTMEWKTYSFTFSYEK